MVEHASVGEAAVVAVPLRVLLLEVFVCGRVAAHIAHRDRDREGEGEGERGNTPTP